MSIEQDCKKLVADLRSRNLSNDELDAIMSSDDKLEELIKGLEQVR